MITDWRKFITKWSRYGMSSFHFYHWNQLKAIPLACAIRTRKLRQILCDVHWTPIDSTPHRWRSKWAWLMTSWDHAHRWHVIQWNNEKLGHWTACDTNLVVHSSQLEIPKTQRSSTNKFSISMLFEVNNFTIQTWNVVLVSKQCFFRKCRFRLWNLCFGCRRASGVGKLQFHFRNAIKLWFHKMSFVSQKAVCILRLRWPCMPP